VQGGAYGDLDEATRDAWMEGIDVVEQARGARSHRRFALPLTHFILNFLRESALLFLKQQCDRTLQARQMRLLERLAEARRGGAAVGAGADEEGAPDGGNAEFLCGLSLGFFLGVIMVFVLCPGPARGVQAPVAFPQ
jgi:hypothetical protein